MKDALTTAVEGLNAEKQDKAIKMVAPVENTFTREAIDEKLETY